MTGESAAQLLTLE